MEERIQKILARAGYGSRRACENLIQNGKVTVNGRLAQLGQKADPDQDQIAVEAQLIQTPEKLKYIAIYKPRNVISAALPQDDRKTVCNLVDEPGTLYLVGRLDVDSDGLILLTNDGELTNKLTHPRYGHENFVSQTLPEDWDPLNNPLWPPEYGGQTWETGSGTAEHAIPLPPPETRQRILSWRVQQMFPIGQGRKPDREKMRNPEK